MPKRKDKEEIRMTLRTSPSNMYDEGDFYYLKHELEKGASKSDILKEAVNICRRYKNGDLAIELLKKHNLIKQAGEVEKAEEDAEGDKISEKKKQEMEEGIEHMRRFGK